MSWLKAMNPSTPITTEAEAERAAKASAISIMIGVVVGLVGLAWTFANPQIMQDAMANAGGGELGQAQMQAASQIAMYTAGFMVLLQVIFGFVQWRRPGKFIAILFLVLLAYGIVSTAATPLLAGSMPNMPHIPAWQIALSLVIMVIQVVLHVTGLKGIKALDRIQMEQAR
ncbi:hypothetical protein [Brevundimonas sp. NIBR11]|uniref:hypothetical protein n=1 Tax=Brevundimonas sp. NIBR11 TaxID=3015999 RepID=UPI0022F11A30|nr:hypothetical protein [Brevundimonas sp. NIBR11]WGM30440.1 hypothetical protein KKHFBJBL_00663 [Brevundimonas sp. NIBR11]